MKKVIELNLVMREQRILKNGSIFNNKKKL